MENGLILSIDIGTTGLKFGIYDQSFKNLYFLRKNTPLIEKFSGTMDVLEIYTAVLSGIKEIAEKSKQAGQIRVIGIDGQMGGIVGINERWEPILPFDPPINNNFKPFMTDILGSHRDLIVAETGSIPINGSKIIYWMKEQYDIFKDIKKIVTLAGYIIGKLINIDFENAFIDRTSLYLFGLGCGNKWSAKLCDILHVPMSILPTVRESTHIVGYLSKGVARRCSLMEGIPIIAGTGDTASSLLGAGIVNPGDAIDLAGTCSVFGVCTAKDIIDTKHGALLRLEAPIPDIYYLVGVGFGGEVYNWFIYNIYCHEGVTEEYAKLIKGAKDISPGSSNLLFFPFLGGSFTPPDDVVRGTWLGLDWNHTVHHLYRSMLEAIAYEYFYYYSIYREISGIGIRGPIVVTGSGRNNDLWNQIKADVLGFDYITLNRADHECLGTALVAGLAVDMITDIRTNLKKCFEIERRYFSNSIRHKEYERMARSYVRFKSDIIRKIYNGFH